MRRSNRGFTLIELLVVIAIIAILTAIIFPVYARAKIAAYRSSDISNLNTIRNALQLYRADQGAYPPAILGYATLYTAGPGNNVVPADQLHSFLYSRRIDSVDTLRPALNRPDKTQITTAVWPTIDATPGPVLDLNGDGVITPADDDPKARQAYGTNHTVDATDYPGGIKGINPLPDPSFNPNQNIDGTTNLHFYNVSGYDVGVVQPGGNANCTALGQPGCTELRYSLFWTIYSLQGVGGVFGSISDDPRQLGYTEPPENTVVTWDSYFRDYSGGTLQRNKNEIVLFLNGNAKPYDSADMASKSFRTLP